MLHISENATCFLFVFEGFLPVYFFEWKNIKWSTTRKQLHSLRSVVALLCLCDIHLSFSFFFALRSSSLQTSLLSSSYKLETTTRSISTAQIYCRKTVSKKVQFFFFTRGMPSVIVSYPSSFPSFSAALSSQINVIVHDPAREHVQHRKEMVVPDLCCSFSAEGCELKRRRRRSN